MCYEVIVTVVCITSNYVIGLWEKVWNVNIDGGTKGDFYFLLYNYLYFFQNVLQ